MSTSNKEEQIVKSVVWPMIKELLEESQVEQVNIMTRADTSESIYEARGAYNLALNLLRLEYRYAK